MKKFSILLLCLLMLVGISGCGSKESENVAPEQNEAETSQENTAVDEPEETGDKKIEVFQPENTQFYSAFLGYGADFSGYGATNMYVEDNYLDYDRFAKELYGKSHIGYLYHPIRINYLERAEDDRGVYGERLSVQVYSARLQDYALEYDLSDLNNDNFYETIKSIYVAMAEDEIGSKNNSYSYENETSKWYWRGEVYDVDTIIGGKKYPSFEIAIYNPKETYSTYLGEKVVDTTYDEIKKTRVIFSQEGEYYNLLVVGTDDYFKDPIHAEEPEVMEKVSSDHMNEVLSYFYLYDGKTPSPQTETEDGSKG